MSEKVERILSAGMQQLRQEVEAQIREELREEIAASLQAVSPVDEENGAVAHILPDGTVAVGVDPTAPNFTVADLVAEVNSLGAKVKTLVSVAEQAPEAAAEPIPQSDAPAAEQLNGEDTPTSAPSSDTLPSTGEQTAPDPDNVGELVPSVEASDMQNGDASSAGGDEDPDVERDDAESF
jgi:hypothetical protein